MFKKKNKSFKYGFWFWSNKLDPILSMLAYLAEYNLWDEEREVIKIGLNGTNDEKNIWFDYLIEGKMYSLGLKFAFDDEEETDMICISIETSIELKEKLESLNSFQCMFKELIEEQR